MGKETTKIVREKTMPMTECQKQKAFHKGIRGSNILSHNRESTVISMKRDGREEGCHLMVNLVIL